MLSTILDVIYEYLCISLPSLFFKNAQNYVSQVAEIEFHSSLGYSLKSR